MTVQRHVRKKKNIGAILFAVFMILCLFGFGVILVSAILSMLGIV